jgi:NAD(P)-dependent dehydrogenase (short-subunit alcohol dehydrogenase family)
VTDIDRPVAWITGAGSGLGRAVALRLVAEGYAIAATSRSLPDLEALAAEPASRNVIHAYAGDVTDREAIADMATRIEAELGPIQLVFLSAGGYIPFPIEQFSAEKTMATMRLNVGGVANVLEAVIPRFLARKRGHIAVVSSLAQYRGLCRTTAYGASKAALLAMCETLYLQGTPKGIKVQIVVPGYIQTRMTEKAPFPLPHIMTAEAAAEEAVKGLKSNRFQIQMPKHFVRKFQLARLLPSSIYFWMASRSPDFGGVRPASFRGSS